MIGVKIKSIEYSLPKKVEYLADLKDNPDWDVKKFTLLLVLKKDM